VPFTGQPTVTADRLLCASASYCQLCQTEKQFIGTILPVLGSLLTMLHCWGMPTLKHLPLLTSVCTLPVPNSSSVQLSFVDGPNYYVATSHHACHSGILQKYNSRLISHYQRHWETSWTSAKQPVVATYCSYNRRSVTQYKQNFILFIT